MQAGTDAQLISTLLISRFLDIGAILVSITAFIVTTRNSVKALRETVISLHTVVEKMEDILVRHGTEIARIDERCRLLHQHRGESSPGSC